MDDDICQDDKWFEQAFTYMSQHDIPLPNDKKLHVSINLYCAWCITLNRPTVLWPLQTSDYWRLQYR